MTRTSALPRRHRPGQQAGTYRTRERLLNWFDTWSFNRDRRHYYDYLAALLQGTRGTRTIGQIFAADAQRYGTRTTRGRLSRRWELLLQAAGGDLYGTWVGIFPPAELAVVRSAQQRGNDALVGTFAEMSRVLSVWEAARAILVSSLLAAVVAVAVLLAMLVVMPLFTVPRLRETFAMVPAHYHGATARGLFEFADVLAVAWPLALGILSLLSAAVLLSFGRYSGGARRSLDRVGPWRVYRQVQALRFLALLAVALGRAEHGTTRLRQALLLQVAGATPWMARHVALMIERIDTGCTGATIFDTGLLDPPQLWFLDDMIAARGLIDGLRQCADRVERHVLGSVARQARVMRWLMLLGAVAGVLAIALWHYAAIDDLRRALALFHASQ